MMCRSWMPPCASHDRHVTVIALITTGALALRLLPLTFGIESTDIQLYRQQALPVVHGMNVYAVTHNVFPYTPVSMFYPALCLTLSSLAGIPFHVVVKLFAIVADAGIVLALGTLGAGRLGPGGAVTAAALYAVNPVSILICAFHGNIMPLVVLLMLTAYLLFCRDPTKNLVVSGLLLGLAVGWRSFPVLLLPFFLAAIDDARRKIRFAVCVIAPPLLSMIPFAWADAAPMLREVLSYSGWGIHHGAFAIVRALHLVAIERVTWEHPVAWTPWMTASKPAFLALYAIAVLFARRLRLVDAILVTFFLFELVYAGVASQYLIWPVPFLLLVNGRTMFWGYQLAATYALVVFYWIFFPDILFGALGAPFLTVTALHHYVVSQVLFSAVCVAGIVMIARGAARTVPAPLAASAVAPEARRPALGVAGGLVCLYYLALFVWEIAFVLRLGRPA